MTMAPASSVNAASPGLEQSPACPAYLSGLVDTTVFQQVQQAENHDDRQNCVYSGHEMLLPNLRYSGLCLPEPASYKVTPR